MKTIIKNVLPPLLLLLAVAGGLVWLLPVRVTLFIVIVLQLLMFVVVGDTVKNLKKNGGHEQV